VEALAEGYGVSKRVVNREMIKATAKDLSDLCERDLSALAIWVLMIDGIRVGKSLIVVALGRDFAGTKHNPGFREESRELPVRGWICCMNFGGGNSTQRIRY
jgi:hypothetical protein